jgi:DHA1 family bicyclomycin/chloramphenicol resistance-like MFS transporter
VTQHQAAPQAAVLSGAEPAVAPHRPSGEFVALVALLTSLVAMSIDAMLPALGRIASELEAAHPNSRQFVVLCFFAGLGAGQLLAGPLSDRIGRKPAILIGLLIYAAGSVMCWLATDFNWFLAGRAIQGIGASAPRVVSIAMVRDRQSGAAMARTMSLVMTVFILVPVLAPAVGQAVLMIASWRVIFLGFFAAAIFAAAWLALRQPETLPRERRRAVSVLALADAARQVLTHRVSMAYTLTAGLSVGLLVGYLGVCQQVFSELYGQGDLFVFYFAVLAAGLGTASAVNARLVMRLGMRRLIGLALRGIAVLTVSMLIGCLITGGQPPLALFMAWLMPIFFCMGMLFGNCNALAMEPMGHIAGMAASIIGSLTSLLSVLAGGLVSQHYDGTVLPLVIGYAVIGVMALLTSMLAGKDYH